MEILQRVLFVAISLNLPREPSFSEKLTICLGSLRFSDSFFTVEIIGLLTFDDDAIGC